MAIDEKVEIPLERIMTEEENNSDATVNHYILAVTGSSYELTTLNHNPN